MADQHPSSPRPLEEWTDEEVVDQLRYLLAELEEVPDVGDNSPVEVLRQELDRRGHDLSLLEGDPLSPGREVDDPDRRTVP